MKTVYPSQKKNHLPPSSRLPPFWGMACHPFPYRFIYKIQWCVQHLHHRQLRACKLWQQTEHTYSGCKSWSWGSFWTFTGTHWFIFCPGVYTTWNHTLVLSKTKSSSSCAASLSTKCRLREICLNLSRHGGGEDIHMEPWTPGPIVGQLRFIIEAHQQSQSQIQIHLNYCHWLPPTGMPSGPFISLCKSVHKK